MQDLTTNSLTSKNLSHYHLISVVAIGCVGELADAFHKNAAG